MDMYSLESPNRSYDSGIFDCGLDVIRNFLSKDDFGIVGEDLFPSLPVVTFPPEEVSRHEDPLLAELLVGAGGSNSTNADNMKNVIQIEAGKLTGDAQKPRRVAFKTKTKLDVLDDGYRWRKYGKKAVKNSPNPRNYYKCTSGGCQVKKIVERWVEDSSYVITQYDGVHTHESPSAYYYSNNNHGL